MKKQEFRRQKSYCKPFWCIFLVVAMLFIIQISVVSAFDFDNIGQYNKTARTFTIKNSVLGLPFLRLGTVAEIHLDTPDVVYVFRGKDRKVAEFTINNYGSYSNVFKKMEFYDIKNSMRKFDRDFTYKYKKSLGFKAINDYETICRDKTSLNGTVYEDCYPELTGTHKEGRFEWVELDISEELPIGPITIGIFTDVYAGDKVEWIPTLFGVRIDEWANWTANLNVNLSAYYKLDDNAANTDVDDELDDNEGTIVGGENSEDMSVAGKVNTSLYFDGNDYIDCGNDSTLDFGTGDFSISLWFRTSVGDDTYDTLLTKMNTAESVGIGLYRLKSSAGQGNKLHFGVRSRTIIYSNNTIHDGAWYHVVIVRDGANGYMYIDSVQQTVTAADWNTDVDVTEKLGIGSWRGLLNYWIGEVDEVGLWKGKALDQDEIDALYNDGDGLSYLPTPFVITLISPVNGTIMSTVGEDFKASYVAAENLTNATYYVWDDEGSIFNQTTVAVTGISNNTTLYIDDFTLGNYEWNVKACTANNCSFAQDNFTLIAAATVDAEQYNNYTYETSLEIFEINVTILPNSILYSAQLFYNETPYEGNITLISAGEYSITTTIDIPQISSPSELVSFFWQLIYPVGGGSFIYQNLTSREQNISQIQLGLCSGGLTNITLNFTNWDEENRTVTTPFDFYGTFLYWLGDGTTYKNFSISNTSINNQTICILPANLTYYTDAQIQYEKSTYVKRSYYLINATLTNVTQHLKLFSLLKTSSTSFIIEVIDESQIPVISAYLYIQRYYAGAGIFETIEMARTDITGATIGHFEVETEDYKVLIVKDGEVLFESGAQKIFCRETPCTIIFQIEPAVGVEWNDFGDITSLIWSLEFDEDTNVWTYTYVDVSGTAQYGRLHVYYLKGDEGKMTICDTNSTSASATLTCNATGYDGEIYAAGYLSRSPEILVYLKSVIIGGLKAILGLEGLFLSMFVLMLLGLLGLWNPTVGIVSIVGGMIILNFMGLASFGAVTIWGVIFIALILLWELKS